MTAKNAHRAKKRAPKFESTSRTQTSESTGTFASARWIAEVLS